MSPTRHTYTVIHPVTPLHRKASRRSPQETELLKGESFDVRHIQRGWAFGQAVSPIKDSVYPGYEGYVPLRYLTPGDISPTHIVTALAAPLFLQANIKSGVNGILPMNARLTGQRDGDFIKTDKAFIHIQHVRPAERPPAERDFVSVAETFLGRPYIWAGISAEGLDCSGLVQTSLRATGRDMARDSSQQAQIGELINPTADLRRGDLIFWEGHVGIMQDSERLLHANAFHMKTASEPLAVAIERIRKNGGGRVTARRRLVL